MVYLTTKKSSGNVKHIVNANTTRVTVAKGSLAFMLFKMLGMASLPYRKYPKTPNTMLTEKATPVPKADTHHHRRRVGSFNVPKTKKEYCWQPNAKAITPMEGAQSLCMSYNKVVRLSFAYADTCSSLTNVYTTPKHNTTTLHSDKKDHFSK